MIEQAARRRRARARIGKGKKIVAHEPQQVRRHHHERHRQRNPGAGSLQCLAGIAVEQQEQRQRRRQHDHEILRPQRRADGEAEQHPMRHAAVPQGRMEGVAGERPQRQLDHVVIELGGREVEVVQAVENEDCDQRANGADQRTRGQPDHREGADHRDLRQRVIRSVQIHDLVNQLDQPPRQRRQLVIAKLPFAPVGERLDEVERQVGIEQCRQRRPHEKMQRQEHGKSRLWTALDGGDQSRHRCGRRLCYPVDRAAAL